MDNKQDNKFYDAVCNKTFSNQSALNKHLKTESHLKKVQFLEVKKVLFEVFITLKAKNTLNFFFNFKFMPVNAALAP